MVSIHWQGKTQSAAHPGTWNIDSWVYPGGGEGAPLNRIYQGDNFTVMSSLLNEFENSIPLIYADPPFFTNRRFVARIGRKEDSRKPKDWQLADGYGDDWNSLDDYLQFLYDRLRLMHRLLSPTGTLYLHLDWHADAYARLLLDEIFGPERFLNEIIWAYHGPSPIRSAFNRKHDTILVYTKSQEYTFNADAVRIPYDETTKKTFASSAKAGFGKIPNLERGKVPEDWWYFPVVARLHNERTGYPTQKPAVLLERIIQASSNPGEWVADFFCGSGTTAVTAARLGRNFITSDATFRAIHTTRKRLIAAQTAPFAIYKSGAGQAILNELAANERLDFWELDPAYNGVIFCSRTHGLLATRNEEKLPAPPKTKPESGARFRAVNVDGSWVVE